MISMSAQSNSLGFISATARNQFTRSPTLKVQNLVTFLWSDRNVTIDLQHLLQQLTNEELSKRYMHNVYLNLNEIVKLNITTLVNRTSHNNEVNTSTVATWQSRPMCSFQFELRPVLRNANFQLALQLHHLNSTSASQYTLQHNHLFVVDSQDVQITLHYKTRVHFNALLDVHQRAKFDLILKALNTSVVQVSNVKFAHAYNAIRSKMLMVKLEKRLSWFVWKVDETNIEQRVAVDFWLHSSPVYLLDDENPSVTDEELRSRLALSISSGTEVHFTSPNRPETDFYFSVSGHHSSETE
jgi:hypothetical protein